MTKVWREYVLVLLAVVFTVSSAIANDDYLGKDDIPNPLAFLPLPPDSSMIAGNGDYARWIWGKAMRKTSRGEQASWESKYGIVRMCTIYSDVLGIEISQESTPALYRFMEKAGNTASNGVSKMKHAHFRRRPFLVMKDTLGGEFDMYDELEFNSSYPSSHTACGWGTALALAEMAPHMQDTILRRGFEYGISRVIVGAHWQTDVEAAMLCASAAISRARVTTEFQEDLAAARQEYMQLKGLTQSDLITSTMPSPVKIIEGIEQDDSYFYYGDVSRYWQAKALRTTERGRQAVADANLSDYAILAGFSACTSIDLSATTAPHITSLIITVKQMLETDATQMKNCLYRDHPYVKLGAPTAIPNEEEAYSKESSYPSRHAIVGWGLALLLVEVMPDCQDALVKRGYDIGWSRVIAGYHYPSDVQAGYVMAACLLANMHNDTTFNNLLQAAKQEYAGMKQ